MTLFNMIFDEAEKQLLVKGLAELAAKESFNLITKVLNAVEYKSSEATAPVEPSADSGSKE